MELTSSLAALLAGADLGFSRGGGFKKKNLKVFSTFF